MPSVQTSRKRPDGMTYFKEFFTSIVIAFAMAFVSMAFVIRGFVIPTSSMAPTLLGAHVRLRSEVSGLDWAQTPSFYADLRRTPVSRQGTSSTPIVAHDPIAGPGRGEVRAANLPLLSGDRVFALRYLPIIARPERFDPLVFISPTNPAENVIKRLVGLPGEQVALSDGDCFVRDGSAGEAPWTAGDWTITRKPERLQRTLWQPIYDHSRRGGDYLQPWIADSGSWDLSGRSVKAAGGENARLRWDSQLWPIDDALAQNEITLHTSEMQRTRAFPNNPSAYQQWQKSVLNMPRYAVGDVHLSAGVRGGAQALRFGVTVRGHEFAGEIDTSGARVWMREVGGTSRQVLHEVSGDYLPGEGVRNVEFWHVDQALWLFVDGELVAGGPERGGYSWTPAERIARAMRKPFTELTGSVNAIADQAAYRPPSPWVEVSGGDLELLRFRIDRDIFWRPVVDSSAQAPTGVIQRAGQGRGVIFPGRATHPGYSPVLGPDQFFLLGDNSTDSEDGRTWGPASAFVKDQFPHAGEGVVPRELVIGRAFVVYLPAWVKRGPVPVPLAGRVRLLP